MESDAGGVGKRAGERADSRLAAEKRNIRAAVRASRAAMTAADRQLARDTLTERLIALTVERGASSLSCYLPAGDEPDTSGFLEWALANDIEVLLPVSLPNHTLNWARHTAADPLPGRHGILEPAGERLPAEAAAHLDLMFIPACAVDEHGGRLGWGLGYYDRSLAALSERPPVFAIVFAADVLPRLPREPHDVAISGVVTQSSTLVFADQESSG